MSKTSPTIESRIVPSATRASLSPGQVSREFMNLISNGAKLVVAGQGKTDPISLVTGGLKPKHKIELLDTQFYLTNIRQIPELRFYVGYVVPASNHNNPPKIYARIFYKDLSLAWRSASHFTLTDGEIWVGKGDVQTELVDGYEFTYSIESTTDLPIEIQTALEKTIQHSNRPINGDGILNQILREGKKDRVKPYPDFSAPRKLAAQNPRNRINKGRPIARFTRPGDPTSLKITAGFEPDFDNGILETSQSKSRLYGGTVKRYRILSTNRKIQYLFLAGPKHVWIIPPQATTTQLSSYGVRTIDVLADDDLFIPGYEYHHWEETANGPELYSQIPSGFAGDICPLDDAKADASPWLNKIPLIQAFRYDLAAR